MLNLFRRKPLPLEGLSAWQDDDRLAKAASVKANMQMLHEAVSAAPPAMLAEWLAEALSDADAETLEAISNATGRMAHMKGR